MKNKILLALILALFVSSSYFIYKKLNPPKLPPYLIEAVGKINGDLININTKYPARIKQIFVDDGDEVKKNQIVAILESKEFNANLKAIKNQIKAKNIELNITKNQLNLIYKNSQNNLISKENQLKQLEYEIETLQKVINQDKRDYLRISKLVNKKLAKIHEKELAKLKLDTDSLKLKALKQKQNNLKTAIQVAKNNELIAKNNLNKIQALKKEIASLKAKKDEIKAMINELTLKSPINGYINKKIANVAEVIPAGGIVVNEINPSSYYLSVYIDTLQNGKIKIGNKAEIFLDSNLNNPIPAKVVSIAQRAEFTPKDVAVRSDRISRVFEVHIKPLKANKLLKLGLPAIGVILIDENKNLPKSLKNLPVL